MDHLELNFITLYTGKIHIKYLIMGLVKMYRVQSLFIVIAVGYYTLLPKFSSNDQWHSQTQALSSPAQQESCKPGQTFTGCKHLTYFIKYASQL